MAIHIDHVVIWVEDPLASVAFYEEVIGLTGERVEEFRAGKAPFPSVRVGPGSIIDLMAKKNAATLNGFPGAEGSAGNKLNHVCFSMSRAEYDALRERLAARGLTDPVTLKHSFGAQGHAPEAFYFRDPDGNVLEARWYE